MSKIRVKVQLKEKKIMIADMHYNCRGIGVLQDGGRTDTGLMINMFKYLTSLKGCICTIYNNIISLRKNQV